MSSGMSSGSSGSREGLRWGLRGGRLRGTAVVTGGSSGIGASFAAHLAERGFDLVLVARREQELRSLAAELEAKHGVQVDVHPADLTDPSQLEGVVELLRARQNLALLVNSAGYCRMGAYGELEAEQIERHIRLNALAPARLTHAALQGFGKRGAIINVSSIASIMTTPYGAAYCASKAFLSSLSTCLARELVDTDIRVQNLRVGLTKTEFPIHAGMRTGDVPGPAWMTPDEVVRASLRALSRNQSLCVPRFANRIVPRVMQALPSRIALSLGRRAATGDLP